MNNVADVTNLVKDINERVRLIANTATALASFVIPQQQLDQYIAKLKAYPQLHVLGTGRGPARGTVSVNICPRRYDVGTREWSCACGAASVREDVFHNLRVAR